MSHAAFIEHMGVPVAHWFIIWDSVMREDPQNLDSVLSHTGWNVKSSDNWELYDIIARFKRWNCMKVVLSKVPIKYLQYRYRAEKALPLPAHSTTLMQLLRDEAYKRGFINVLLRLFNLPDDMIIEVWEFLL